MPTVPRRVPARTAVPWGIRGLTGRTETRHGPQRSVTTDPEAQATVPVQAARTGVPGRAARSIPRCWPARNGAACEYAYGRATEPGTGGSRGTAVSTAGTYGRER